MKPGRITTRTCSDNCAKNYYKARQRAEKIEASNRETIHTRLKPIEDLRVKEYLTVADVADPVKQLPKDRI